MKEWYKVSCVKIPIFCYLFEIRYLSEILCLSPKLDTSKNVVKSTLFCNEEWQIFLEIKKRCEVSSVKKNLADLLGIQYLFQILHTLLTVNNSKNVAKSGCFKKLLR